METIDHGKSLPALERRRLGSTNLEVSIVGFGVSPLGDVFGQTDAAERVAAVHYAVERGINFFDVSPYYGLTLAEERLGEALDGYRHRVVLATKCGRYAEDRFDFSAKKIEAGLEDSLRRLRTDHVDLLQAHDIEFASAEQIVNETLPAMRQLQAQGKARYIGITGYSLKNLVAVASRSQVDSILSYCRSNLLMDDLYDDLAPFAAARKIGLINASPLHMGMLTEPGAPSWHPAPAKVGDIARQVMALCREHGLSGSQLALRFCLEQPDVASTLVGMSTRKEVDQNLAAVSMAPQPELLAAIKSLVVPVFNCTWPSGLKENYG